MTPEQIKGCKEVAENLRKKHRETSLSLPPAGTTAANTDTPTLEKMLRSALVHSSNPTDDMSFTDIHMLKQYAAYLKKELDSRRTDNDKV